MYARLLYCALSCLLLGDVLFAQTHLVWKFNVGQVYECERAASQTQSVELKGKTITSTRRSTWRVRLEVIEKDASAARIHAKLISVEHRIMPAADDALKLDRKMQGGSFMLTVTPTGRLTKLDGYEDFLNRLAAGDKDVLKALRATFPLETFQQAFADFFGPLPMNAVNKGDRWQHAVSEPIPHFGTLRSTVQSIHAGTKGSLDRIEYTVAAEIELPKDDKSVLFRVTKGSVTSEKSFGILSFEKIAGRLASHERSIRLRGTFTVELMDQQYPMAFSSDSEVKIHMQAAEK
jgi:hypothetical protein